VGQSATTASFSRTAGALPALLVVLPLVGRMHDALALYFAQRELGWVNTSWLDLGVPVWLSFAFWQWAAVALLWGGLGHLVAAGAAASEKLPQAPLPARDTSTARTAALGCNSALCLRRLPARQRSVLLDRG
jgi:hypothetical protein